MARTNNRNLLLLLPYVLVFAILGATEGLLRVFNPSLTNPLVNEVTYDGIEWYQVNRSYLKKYFSPGTPLIPEFKTSLFRKNKGSSTYRVFCLGESSMFGTPYQMTCNIPGIVRKQLRHLYPNKEFEVINLGASAINTNVIRDLSPLLLKFNPDLILLYTGHNEFYGPDGVGAGFVERHSSWIIPFKYQLRELRLVAFIQNLLHRSPEESNLNLMQEVSQGNTVPLHSEASERIFKLFSSNLHRIIETFRDANVPVIVSDVTSNLTFAPFISDSLHGAGQLQHYVAVSESTYAKGNYQDILDSLSLLRTTDSSNASVNYWMGKADVALGKYQEAKRLLVEARDNDLLKFRAPSRINEILQDVAVEEQVPFVSTDSLFSRLSENGIAGDEFYWEHLHPTERGYYAIANLFVREIVRRGFVEKMDDSAHIASLLPLNNDSLSICWLDLAYGDLSVQHLTGRWPFVDYHRRPAVLDSADAAMMNIARAAYGRSIDWDEACYKLAVHFWKSGQLRAAETMCEAMIEEYPYSFYNHYLLGSLLNQKGELSSAVMHYRRSIELNSLFPNSRLDIGLIEINLADFDGALKDLSAALATTSEQTSASLKANIHYGLAAAYANKGNLAKALDEADTAIRLQPGYRDAMVLRDRILQQPP